MRDAIVVYGTERFQTSVWVQTLSARGPNMQVHLLRKEEVRPPTEGIYLIL